MDAFWSFFVAFVLSVLGRLCIDKVRGVKNQRGIIRTTASFFVLYALIAFGLVIAGKVHSLHLESPWVRGALCFAFVWGGMLYHLYQETAWAALFGIIQVVAGAANNWHQLKEIALHGLQQNMYERVVFIVAGFAIISKGWKDVDTGEEKFEKGIFIPHPHRHYQEAKAKETALAKLLAKESSAGQDGELGNKE